MDKQIEKNTLAVDKHDDGIDAEIAAQIQLDADHNHYELLIQQARTDTLNSIKESDYSQILWSKHPDLDGTTVRWAIEALTELVKELRIKSGELPGEG